MSELTVEVMMKAKAWSDMGKLEWAKKGRQVASGSWKKKQKKTHTRFLPEISKRKAPLLTSWF